MSNSEIEDYHKYLKYKAKYNKLLKDLEGGGVFFSSTGQKDMKATQVNTTAKEKSEKISRKRLRKSKG